jgi:hypothetical protein
MEVGIWRPLNTSKHGAVCRCVTPVSLHCGHFTKAGRRLPRGISTPVGLRRRITGGSPGERDRIQGLPPAMMQQAWGHSNAYAVPGAKQLNN